MYDLFYFMLNDIYFEDKNLSFNNDHWHTLLWNTMSVINEKLIKLTKNINLEKH